ncbi:radical SAM protein [Chitinophaga ginsengisoli]|uniref:Radical SAM core domain-containing protein n=1 Tax=Chitinophaga ginsengisoli TaxID=363837 RepID=A0A2P8GKG4_9BACT|nr:radical SAM protein [Chitinophaga ginsengisoli]PSL34453.1 uncharacterized protein CLV42_10224 [Chitinophaga ginsengisoli]
MKKISSFVLKIASRCNLNCSYCYMYNLGDKTYMNQPKFMSIDTITALAERLRSYCNAADIQFVQIVFHGGEPLLLSKEFFRESIEIFTSTCPDIEFSYTIQTNGVQLDNDWYHFFNEYQVKIGISFDGPRQQHDKYRRFHNGKGSYDDVATAVRLGKDNGLAGILMVLNTDIPPADFYNEIKQLGVRNLNLLFPDGHHSKLPGGFDMKRLSEAGYTPYADWLIALFVLWKKDKSRPTIRLFENIIALLMGNEQIGNQAMGKKTNGVAVIETNGGIEVVDSLRACYEGITRNNLNVHTGKIEDLFGDDVFELFYNSHEMVCEQCLNCPVYDICGGGFLGNRFSEANGFDNPTIYCKDIIRLVSFLQNDILESLPPDTVDRIGIEKMSYEEVLEELKRPADIPIDNSVKQKLISFKQLS